MYLNCHPLALRAPAIVHWGFNFSVHAGRPLDRRFRALPRKKIEPMATPDLDHKPIALIHGAETSVPNVGGLPIHPQIAPKTKNSSIRVSPAVIDAAHKDAEEVLRDLSTSMGGLTQAEAEKRARTTGPNEVARERRQEIGRAHV